MVVSQLVKRRESELPIRIKVTKELRYQLETYSVFEDLILGVDHTAVCQSQCVKQVFLLLFPPLLVHLSNEESWDPGR